MKKVIVLLIALCMTTSVALAKCSNCGHSHSGNCHNSHNHSSSGDSHPVYLVRTENHTDQVKFSNCNEHYAVTETTTNIYSDGTRRSVANSTVYNADGTVLESDCRSVKHTVYDNKHYFLIRKTDGYKIIDDKANIITKRSYSAMTEIEPNRIFVKRDKKYGIIDLSDKVVVPIKYQKLDFVNKRVMIAKLNGYYGVIDIDNEILIAPDCDRIKPLYDTIVLKRYHKYGLTDLNGELILSIKYDKIKKLGEYIVVKKDNKYGVLDYKGEIIGEIIYKQIKLERNKLKGVIDKNKVVDL